MSLEEYNKHSTFGPSAGPATTAAAMAGQSTYAANHSRPLPVSTYRTSSSSPAERPRWMRRHPFKRGLALLVLAQILFVVIATVVKPGSVTADLLSLALLVVMVVGLIGVVVGIMDALERRRRKPAG